MIEEYKRSIIIERLRNHHTPFSDMQGKTYAELKHMLVMKELALDDDELKTRQQFF